MDPFLGLGSSAVAAAGLGVDFIGVEIDEHYLVEAIARVRRALAESLVPVPSPWSAVPVREFSKSQQSRVPGPNAPEFRTAQDSGLGPGCRDQDSGLGT